MQQLYYPCRSASPSKADEDEKKRQRLAKLAAWKASTLGQIVKQEDADPKPSLQLAEKPETVEDQKAW